ncbi:hypothetical protein ACFVWR_12870 [Leifsonia sp. NPDC058292]|uniref:hypothetical protein n=1 Tax=Leifsonia sp. NPDC058292 TaxID=3346428 RepID=UPI0036DBB610
MDVTEWLLDSDPAIRWQVLRDLTDASPDVVAAERARVATEGWGAALLAEQDPEGTWDGDVFFPPWTSTLNTVQLLHDLGIDPQSPETRRAIDLVARNVHWQEEFGSNLYFDGEVEACINGRVFAAGAYFGHPSTVLRDRLVGERLADGGWNCYVPPSERSSFNSTICVLEGLLEYETAVGATAETTEARRTGEQYLLDRGLLRRLSTGEIVDEDWTKLSFPVYYSYDVLRGLEYFRAAGAEPDDRFAEAIALIEGKRDADGRWALEHTHEGKQWFEMEPEGEPSRWITLRALRVLAWYHA